uniref:Secreted protein n=1 Tax=Ditylenchus dipsaci TaxID=166011 RepID=A0A915DA50_9BILA
MDRSFKVCRVISCPAIARSLCSLSSVPFPLPVSASSSNYSFPVLASSLSSIVQVKSQALVPSRSSIVPVLLPASRPSCRSSLPVLSPLHSSSIVRMDERTK